MYREREHVLLNTRCVQLSSSQQKNIEMKEKEAEKDRNKIEKLEKVIQSAQLRGDKANERKREREKGGREKRKERKGNRKEDERTRRTKSKSTKSTRRRG